MRTFRFSLAALLRVKELRERLAEGRVYTARGAVTSCEERLARLQRSLAELAARLETVQPDGWAAAFEQSSRLDAAIRRAEGELAEAEAALRQAEAERSALAREAEALETLRREQLGLHRKECQRAEQERLDEIGLRRWSQDPRQGEDAQ